MSKTKRFDIEAGEPHGTTFDNCPGKFAGSSNSKRSARFGIGNGDPTGTTFVKNSSHIDFPKASGTPKATKVESKSGGQGKYSPSSKGPQDFGGSIPIGKSSRK